MRLTIVLKKQFIFLWSLFIISSCANKKEAVLLSVLKAIEQDEMSKVEHLCTPECFKQIELRKLPLRSLVREWDLLRNHLKCTSGETAAKCFSCNENENCTPLDLLKLSHKDGKWLVDYNELSPAASVERFLGYLEKLDFDAAKKISGRHLKKELESMKSVIALLKETGMLHQKELDKLRRGITEIAYFDPTIQWIKCRDDNKYQSTKICFLCDPLHGETNEAIRVTMMRDKKWYVEHYSQ